MGARLGPRVWAVTLGLVAAAAVGVSAVLATGAPLLFVATGVGAVALLAYASWWSGGGYEAETMDARPIEPTDPPEYRNALLRVCERADRPVPRLVRVEMDVPGVMVGYDDGSPVIAVDAGLLSVVGPGGLEALFAHELGHLGGDLHADAVRRYLPQVIGFSAVWVVLLAGRGPVIASVGTVGYVVLAALSHPAAFLARGALSLGTEPLALAASRYANRREELNVDRYAADLVSPAAITEALFRIAAVATGDNDEDVTGPVPWEDDRTLAFSLFATHPSIERRAAALGVEVPDWARRSRPSQSE